MKLVTAIVLVLAMVPLDASAQYFGRNKVQYRAFDFEVIKTEHFDVYYYAQEREAVMDAARMAERSYARLSRILQHEFRERKPIILYASHGDFQQTNALSGFIDEGTGGVTEAFKSRVIMPFTGSYADFDHVLTHELVHVFQYDIILRRGTANEGSPMGARLPLWFMEGMAEYLSIGRIDALTISWLRDASLYGYIRDIGQMSVRDDYLSYRFGQSLWHYIGSKWGDEVVGILLQKAPRMSLERAFATTLGITLAELSREWLENVRKTYLPQVAEFAQPNTFAQRLTNHEKLEDAWYLSPAISPDGTRMVYLSQRDGFYFDLWLADARTGKPLHKLVAASNDANFESLRFMSSNAAFSPDGKLLAFSAQSSGRDALYIFDVNRRKVVRKLVFELDGVDAPSFSPDGQRIVFSGNEGGLSDLFVTDLSGKLTRLTRDRYADLTPSWSPDGKSIAFTTDRGPGTDLDRLTYGNFRVALIDVADLRIRILPHQDVGKNHNPVWAPDSRSLVWVNDATGTNNLHLFELETQQLHRISNLLSGVIAVKDISPVLSWSRDGKLLFSYFEKAGYNTYAVADPRKLPRFPIVEPPRVIAKAGTSTPNQADPLQLAGRNGDNGASAEKRSPAPSATVNSYYRSGSEIRPSSQQIDPAETKGAVSVTALLDSAVMALPDTAAFKHRDYKVKFTADMVGQPSIGAQVGGYNGASANGGSFVALSDMLGNHNILLAGSVNGSISDASFFGGYNFLKTRANVGFVIEQLPYYRYFGGDYMTVNVNGQARDVFANVFIRDVVRTSAAYLSYPFSTFRRLELGVSGTYYKSEVLYRGFDENSGEPFDHNERIETMKYLQPMAALVFDNSLFGWTGPIFGRRYRAQISHTIGDLGFTEGLLDFRNYWNYKKSIVFAARLVGLSRTGNDSERFAAYWGDPYYIRGYDAGSFELNSEECARSRGASAASPCPVRDQLIGSSAAFMNLELRMPVIKELQIGFLGAFPPIDLVTFFDGGVAWDDKLCMRASAFRPGECAAGQERDINLVWNREPGQDPFLYRAPVFSYGVGLRFNVMYAVLRFDYSVPMNRPERSSWRDGVFSLSFGPSF